MSLYFLVQPQGDPPVEVEKKSAISSRGIYNRNQSAKIGTSHPQMRRNGLVKLENSIPRTTKTMKV